jgi:SpoVK/Ycf46/Vps4 family AAA+-type ATPase
LFHQLLWLLEDPAFPRAPLLNRYLKVDERIVAYLLDDDEIDERLTPYVSLVNPRRDLEELILSEEMRDRLSRLLQIREGDRDGMNVYFQGPYGVGKKSVAEALCKIAGSRLLIVDGVFLLNAGGGGFTSMVRTIFREANLQDSAIYWSGFDTLLADDQYVARKVLLHQLQEWDGMVFLAGEAVWEPADVPGLSVTRIEFPRPDYGDRLRFWQNALEDAEGTASATLANRFRFSGGQIRDAGATARNLARQHEPDGSSISINRLFEACRLQSNRKLAALATHIRPRYTFADIVLPADTLRQLMEIRSAVEYRSIVHDEWGFGAKLSLGKGFGLLFAGPSGTGKTMAAEILAHELGLDLYKIDLSTVVSKYIGETEKNLSRIFAEAETSNAILFFDEADALFGKRSEVRDSHDRYANIEVNYLLQRIEEYEGVIILASNLRKNMDEAFVRRIYATIEFPFPDAEGRLRIWQGVWPMKTPRQDLDLEFMASRFELTGGNIRNIALAAAFLGAERGGCVRMEHLIRATWKEYQKMGKVIMEGEFGKYAHLAHFS